MNTKGMLAWVYRCANGMDCTLDGISSKHETLILVGEGVPELFRPSEESPAVYLRREMVMGEENVYVSPEPHGNQPWRMFGGNFLYSNDSRFPTGQPLKIHDRTEP
ncbi:MAG TPA: hypothetical protein PK395_20685 [bacterium]|nr:hypothetical protein [bacterium]